MHGTTNLKFPNFSSIQNFIFNTTLIADIFPSSRVLKFSISLSCYDSISYIRNK